MPALLPRRLLPILVCLSASCLGCGDTRAPRSSTAPANVFVDRAEDFGLRFTHVNGMSGRRYMAEIVGGGGALFDYDQDGDLDLYLVQGNPLDKNAPQPHSDRLWRNDLGQDGRPRFIDVTPASGIRAHGYGMGVAVGDVDNDGFPDLYVTNLGPNQLWRNNGDGTFSDITPEADRNDTRWSTSAAFVDYDRDGFLDLFVGNYVDFTIDKHQPCYSPSGSEDYCGPLSYRPYTDRLWHNTGNGVFEDVSQQAGITAAYGGALGVVAADFNDDGWIDLYVANDGSANQLWTNRRDGTFVNDALLGGAAFNEMGNPEASMGVDAADFDGDGDEDLFMTHLSNETNTLYRNDGSGLFEDHTSEAGLGMPSRGFTGFGTAWMDYDNDGWLDLMVANGAVRVIAPLSQAGDPFPLHQKNQFFRNTGQGRFSETSSDAGEVFALSEVSRGIAVGDVDNDGDTDALLHNNNGPARLLINQTRPANAWIGLRLLGRAAKRYQYGARIALTLDDGRVLWRRVRAAASYCSSNDPRVLVGLGAAGPASIEVRWPDGSREFWDGKAYAAGRYYTLVQGTGRGSL